MVVTRLAQWSPTSQSYPPSLRSLRAITVSPFPSGHLRCRARPPPAGHPAHPFGHSSLHSPFNAPYGEEDTVTRASPPRLQINTSTPPDSGSVVASGSNSNEKTPVEPAPANPKPRVRWPEQLSEHVSIQMHSPTSAQTMRDEGAEAALTRALEAHSADESAFPSRFVGQSGSEAPSRAESSDGDPDERMQNLKENMEVFVDPNERDGLPSVGSKPPDLASKTAAWNLVRGMAAQGHFRQRKNAANGGFSGGMGAGANSPGDEEAGPVTKVKSPDSGEGDEVRSPGEGAAGFFKKVFTVKNDDDLENMAPPSSFNAAAGGGILSALIALQQQQQQQQSATSSGVNTPTSLAPSRLSTAANSSDEDEDEEERLKFIAKLREKRARQGVIGNAAGHVAGAGKSVGGVVMGGAGAIAGGAASGAHSVVTGASSAFKFGSKAHSRAHSQDTSAEATPGPRSSFAIMNRSQSRANSNPGSPPISPIEPSRPSPSGQQKKKRTFVGETASHLRKIGNQLGLDIETEHSRPAAARSGAGVFGGLMLSTANIAGVATPAANTLAPIVNRPGYHLSRYSAPHLPTQAGLDRRSKSMESTRQSSDNLARLNASAGDSPHSRDGTEDTAIEPLTTPPLGASTQSDRSVNEKSAKSSSGFSKASKGFGLHLKDLPGPTNKFGFSRPHSHSGQNSPRAPSTAYLGDYFNAGREKETIEEREKREWDKEKRKRKKAADKRKAQEVFITMHVAALLERQNFIMKMARSFMMFGAPSHRLEAQIQATARVLEINCQVIYIPGVMLVSFGDASTHTSEIKFLKQANGLDLGKLLLAYYVYYNVIHDKISVTDAGVELDELMKAPPKYKLWQNLIIGALASAFIQPSAFYGSFIDCLISMPLGALLVLVQVTVSRNDLYSSLFEIVIACINSFLAAALGSINNGNTFCFAAIVSGSIVLILPGYIVLCGALELANRGIVSGSVRLVYSVLYSLFLGFGLSMGSEVYNRVTGKDISTDYTCAALRVDVPWYQSTISPWFYFLTAPCYLLMLGLRNGQPLWRKETPVMLIVGCAGFAANYFSGRAFVNRSDISSAIGSFVVGFLGNIYGKFTRGSPFVVMVVGVLFQLPSGLSNGGLLQLTNTSDTSSTNFYSSGFTTAESLVEVAIGLTVGLFLSAAVVNAFGGGRRRGTNLSSF